MTKLPIKEAWELFNSIFKNGDSVFVVTDDDEEFWGTMRTTELGVYLLRSHKKERYFLWDDIRFISHDGFPVRKLLGADGSKSSEDEPPVNRSDLVVPSSYSQPYCSRRHYAFGDPYLIESVESSYLQTYYLESHIEPAHWEELLLLRAQDGAVGMLYHFESIYFCE